MYIYFFDRDSDYFLNPVVAPAHRTSSKGFERSLPIVVPAHQMFRPAVGADAGF
jgi:hypothetical protein